MSAYYLGQKSVDGIHLGTILDEFDSFLVNDDMDEWGEAWLPLAAMLFLWESNGVLMYSQDPR